MTPVDENNLEEKLEGGEENNIDSSNDDEILTDHFSSLPREISLHILSFLSITDVIRLSQVSSHWASLIGKDPLLWRQLYCNKWGSWCTNESVLVSYSNRETYKRRYKLEANWFQARCQLHTFVAHSYGTRPTYSSTNTSPSFSPPLSSFSPPRHSSFSYASPSHTPPYSSSSLSTNPSSSISSSNNSSSFSNSTHSYPNYGGTSWSSSITCLQFNETILVTGSSDTTLKVWDIGPSDQSNLGLDCINILHGHQSPIQCMSLEHFRVVSGSYDGSIRIWNTATGKCTGLLMDAHVGGVNCLKLKKNLMISGGEDYTVKLFDIKQGQCVRIYEGHTDRSVYCIDQSLPDGLLLSGGSDSTLRLWDPRSSFNIATIPCPSPIVRLQLEHQKLVTGDKSGAISLWDLRRMTDGSGEMRLVTKLYHGNRPSNSTCNTNSTNSSNSNFLDWVEIRGLQFDKTKLVSSGTDNQIKLWNLERILNREKSQLETVVGNQGGTGHEHGEIDFGEARIFDEKNSLNNRSIQTNVSLGGSRSSDSNDQYDHYWDPSFTQSFHGASCLQFDETKLVSGSTDGKLLIFDFDVKEKTKSTCSIQ